MDKKSSTELTDQEILKLLSALQAKTFFKPKEPRDELSREISEAIAACRSTHPKKRATQYGTLKLG